MIRKFITSPLVLVLGLLVYLPLLNGYFIQDEWQLFAIYQNLDLQPFIQVITSFFIPQPSQYVPLTQVLSYILFKLFHLNYLPYFLVGLLCHLLVAYLLYRLVDLVVKIKQVALLSGLLFLIAPEHFQATSWILANISYSLSASCLLLGLIFYYKWLFSHQAKYAFYCSIYLLVSLLFKQITVFMILALPLLTIVKVKRLNKKVFQTLTIVSPMFILTLWNLWFIKSHPIAGISQSSIAWRNLILLPFKSITQSILPQDLIYHLSETISPWFFPNFHLKPQTTEYDLFIQSKGTALVIGLFTLIIFLVGWMIYKKARKKLSMYILTIFIAGASGLAYFLVDTPNFSLLQPRYLYIPVLFSSCLISYLCSFLINHKRLRLIVVIAIVGLFGLFTFQMSNELANIGYQRRELLEQIGQSFTSPSQSTIIYTQSSMSYYGLPVQVHILPFQEGLGKTLAVYLRDKIYIPKMVLNPETLWSIDSQGYYQDNRGGFGYFRDWDLLVKTIRQDNLPIIGVVSFYWDGSNNTLINTTDKTKNQLTATLNEKN